MRGGDGKFYIVPITAGLSGMSFRNLGDAEAIADAINSAYSRGREDVKRDLRDLIGAEEQEQ